MARKLRIVCPGVIYHVMNRDERVSRMQSFKNIKNFLVMLRVNADPAVLDIKLIRVTGFMPTDLNHRRHIGLGEFDRVADKIKKYRRDFNAVTNNFR